MRIGDVGGEGPGLGVEGGSSEVEGEGDAGGDRHERSNSKSVKTSKMDVSIFVSAAGMESIATSGLVLWALSLSLLCPSFNGWLLVCCFPAAMALVTVSDRLRVVRFDLCRPTVRFCKQ